MSHHAPGKDVIPWIRAGLTGALLLGSLLSVPAGAQSDDLETGRPAGALVIAAGPFGRVAGLRLADGAGLPDLGSLEALDAYGRGARIELRPEVGTLGEWRLTSYPEPAPTVASGIELASGSDARAASIRFPSSGLFLVRFDATVLDPRAPGAPDTRGSWVWRIAVPDRDIPTDGDPYPPAPAIVLASGDHSVELDVGSGCFVGTCGDIGATSPPRTLPTLTTLAGAPLTVRLSDDSGIDAWVMDATPIGAMDDQTVVLAAGTGDPPPTKVTFAAPAEGRWVILVHVRFERERGSYDGYGRLILGRAGATADR